MGPTFVGGRQPFSCLGVSVLHPGNTPLGHDPEWLKVTRFPEMCLNGVSILWVHSQVIPKPLPSLLTEGTWRVPGRSFSSCRDLSGAMFGVRVDGRSGRFRCVAGLLSLRKASRRWCAMPCCAGWRAGAAMACESSGFFGWAFGCQVRAWDFEDPACCLSFLLGNPLRTLWATRIVTPPALGGIPRTHRLGTGRRAWVVVFGLDGIAGFWTLGI